MRSGSTEWLPRRGPDGPTCSRGLFLQHRRSGCEDRGRVEAGRGCKDRDEAGDDFLLTNHVTLTHATFTGLLSRGVDPSQIGDVAIENLSDFSQGFRRSAVGKRAHTSQFTLGRDL